MTFVKTVILHYPDFGGYLGVDGNEPVRIENGCAYEINPGKHIFRIYSDEANAKSRKASPDIPTVAEGEEPVTPEFLDPWIFTETLTDNECLLITVESDGMKVERDPVHQVFKISTASANKYLDTVKRTEQKPRFHAGLSVTGIILFWIGILVFLISLMIYDPPFVTASEPVIVGAVMLLLSIVMMVAGFIWKKKPKKK
jgi:hypothetical protein